MTTEQQNTDSSPKPSAGVSQFRMERHCARILALQFLFQLDCQKEWTCSDEQFRTFFEQIGSIEDMIYPQETIAKAWRYAKKLIPGIVEKHEELDEMIQSCADNWSLHRMGAIDRNLMRLSAYEMLNMPKMTPGICINEAVDIAKEFGIRESPRFINGVLDQIHKRYQPTAEN